MGHQSGLGSVKLFQSCIVHLEHDQALLPVEEEMTQRCHIFRKSPARRLRRRRDPGFVLLHLFICQLRQHPAGETGHAESLPAERISPDELAQPCRQQLVQHCLFHTTVTTLNSIKLNQATPESQRQWPSHFRTEVRSVVTYPR